MIVAVTQLPWRVKLGHDMHANKIQIQLYTEYDNAMQLDSVLYTGDNTA